MNIHKIARRISLGFSRTELPESIISPDPKTIQEVKGYIRSSKYSDAEKKIALALADEYLGNALFRNKVLEGMNSALPRVAGFNPLKSLKARYDREGRGGIDKAMSDGGYDFPWLLTLALFQVAAACLAETQVDQFEMSGMAEWLRDVNMSLSVMTLIGSTLADYKQTQEANK